METLRGPVIINVEEHNGAAKPDLLSAFPSAEVTALYISVITPRIRRFICVRVSRLGCLRR